MLFYSDLAQRKTIFLLKKYSCDAQHLVSISFRKGLKKTHFEHSVMLRFFLFTQKKDMIHRYSSLYNTFETKEQKCVKGRDMEHACVCMHTCGKRLP